MAPEISVVIPTHIPGRNSLARVLGALKLQAAVPPRSYEVIVVENPEETEIGKLLTEQHGFRHEVCPILGANAARNYGTERSRAEIIALLDDDAVPMPTWISRLMGLHGFYPNVGIIGGRFELEFLSEKPRWISGTFLPWLSEVNWSVSGFTDIHAQPGRYVVSGNLTYKKSKWKQVGKFPEWAGLRGRETLIVNDEPAFVAACGEIGDPHVGYDPELIVKHLIPADRCTLAYMLARGYGQGYADGRDWMRLGHGNLSIQDVYYKYVQGPAERFIYFGEICSARERISHEESTREYIRNLIICRTEYFKGVIDAIERDGDMIWKDVEREKRHGQVAIP